MPCQMRASPHMPPQDMAWASCRKALRYCLTAAAAAELLPVETGVTQKQSFTAACQLPFKVAHSSSTNKLRCPELVGLLLLNLLIVSMPAFNALFMLIDLLYKQSWLFLALVEVGCT